jgi:flagellum-specific ATP synthase
MPTGDLQGLLPNARVIPRGGAGSVRVGPQLLGRVIDGAGVPLDGRGPLRCEPRVSLTGSRSTRCSASRSPSRSTSACARSMRC